ncbi:DUF1835 domain-containing protein [Gracilibacillus massiliensis]|uniref:DUF1835 domain-containing protein n=1 Tax=Gracilibacillus massiliensis TaxID=1564956 RepID=UPI00071D0EA8|nr:DUF1835 domain-containing protein [Gracilibacillus massiliensis]
MIHIVFGATPTSNLTYALQSKSHKVIGFPIDFSVGPLTNIHKESGIEHYFNWLKSSFHLIHDNLEDDQETYCRSLQKIVEIEDGEQITIWTCENASEQIGLRIACYLLKDKNVEVNYINTYHAMHDYIKDKEVRVNIRHTGECNREQLLHFYRNSIHSISEEMKSDYSKKGEKLLSNNSPARSWLDGNIVNEKETKDDRFILEHVQRLQRENNNDYIKAIIVIGEVFGHTDQALSDVWIEYRIRSLIDSQKLVCEGNLHSIWTYKVRAVE